MGRLLRTVRELIERAEEAEQLCFMLDLGETETPSGPELEAFERKAAEADLLEAIHIILRDLTWLDRQWCVAGWRAAA